VKNTYRLAAFAVLLAAIIAALALFTVRDWLTLGLVWIQDHRQIAWLVFVVAYILATVLVIPGSLLTLAAGFVFGLPLGVALVSAGSTLGACCAFLIGRYLTRGWVEQRVAGHAKFKALDLATRNEGFLIVFLARLSPLFPFNLLNYGLSLTAVRFRDYALASWIGMLPATVLYVYIGTAANDLSQIASGNIQSGVGGRVLLLGGLIATVALTVVITRKATQALRRHLDNELAQAGELQ
jgi:uncharacterized membrane protein YdjX (TVP38/TMEM64 family)